MVINDGFEMFDIMFTIIPIFFVLVAGIILFTFIKGIKTWSYNNKQPRLKVGAVMVSKRLQVSGGGEDYSSSTWSYVTFNLKAATESNSVWADESTDYWQRVISAKSNSKAQDTMDLQENNQGYKDSNNQKN